MIRVRAKVWVTVRHLGENVKSVVYPYCVRSFYNLTKHICCTAHNTNAFLSCLSALIMSFTFLLSNSPNFCHVHFQVAHRCLFGTGGCDHHDASNSVDLRLVCTELVILHV